MEPPIFVWKSGILDVFDTVAELEQRYLADALAGDDIAFYDRSGRILVVSADSTGSPRIACDSRQPPQPDRLAALLRNYLERGGMSAETFGSLSLSALIQKVYPSSEPSVRSSTWRRRLRNLPMHAGVPLVCTILGALVALLFSPIGLQQPMQESWLLYYAWRGALAGGVIAFLARYLVTQRAGNQRFQFRLSTLLEVLVVTSVVLSLWRWHHTVDAPIRAKIHRDMQYLRDALKKGYFPAYPGDADDANNEPPQSPAARDHLR
jgi:hypothetical protein